MAEENLRVFEKADIDKYGNISFLFKIQEWTEGVLTDEINFRSSCHITECLRSEFEQVQAFSLMSEFYPDPDEEPVQTDVDILAGKIAESERILSDQRGEFFDLTGEIVITK